MSCAITKFFRISPLLLASALISSAAIAQSQAGGSQQLISELQGLKETPPSNDDSVETTVDAQASYSPDLGEIQIGSIIVADTDGVVRPEFSTVIEQFIGTTAGQAGLRDIATAIAADARTRGFIFASAYIPQQQITLGNLQVTVDLGRIDDVEINGSSNSRLAATLASLRGKYARKQDVERALLLIQDIPGVVIDGTDYARNNGRGQLLVRAKDRSSSGWVSIDNYGDKAAGPYRGRLEVDYSGLLDDDDRMSTSVTVTPFDPEELTFVSARYANILDNDGSQLWLTAGAGRTREMQPSSDWRSRSRYVALAFNRPVVRSSAASVWLTAEAAFLDVDQVPLSGAALQDRVTTLSLSVSGNAKLAGGRLSGGVTLVQGLNVLGATNANDPLSSRTDGSAVFTKEQLWLNWFSQLGSGFSMRIAGNGQLASKPLLASQEIGLGGAGFGRAYSYYERSGDEGAMGLLELRHVTDKPTRFIDWIQMYGFVDGGVVNNLDDDFGSGGLMSGGAGIRSGFGKAELGLEVALPVDDVRTETLDRSPRFNLSLGYRF